MSNQNIGTVTQIIGPVLDIKFPDGHLPGLLNAITVENGADTITLEVAQHIGDDVVRCIAMSSTDGLVRGAKAVDTGSPITVPVGDQCLGRIFNLLGDPVDNLPAPEAQVAIEDLRAALVKYRDAHGKEAVQAMLHSYGVEKLSDLPRERYADMLTEVSA